MEGEGRRVAEDRESRKVEPTGELNTQQQFHARLIEASRSRFCSDLTGATDPSADAVSNLSSRRD